jgi:hypothetical protein
MVGIKMRQESLSAAVNTIFREYVDDYLLRHGDGAQLQMKALLLTIGMSLSVPSSQAH